MLVILVLGLLYMYILPYGIGQVEIWRGGRAVSRESLCCSTRVVTSNQQCLPRLKAPAHVLSPFLHQSCRQLAQGSIFEYYTGLWATIAPTVDIVTERTKPSSPLKVANFTGLTRFRIKFFHRAEIYRVSASNNQKSCNSKFTSERTKL